MAKSSSNIDEKRIAGASYIFAFYKEVQTLTDYYAQYVNFLLDIKTKHNVTLDKLGDAEKETVAQAVQAVRASAHKSYIQYVSICGILKIDVDDKIEESYKQVKEVYIIPEEDIKNYVVGLNQFLVKDIIKKLLEDSQDFMEQLYTENDNEQSSGSGGS